MKKCILLHAIDPRDSAQVDLVGIITSRIESIIPIRGSLGVTAVNLTDGDSYRVTETVQEIHDRIYPNPFIELDVIGKDNIVQSNPILVRRRNIEAVTRTNKTGAEYLLAVEVKGSAYIVKNSLASLKEMLNDD